LEVSASSLKPLGQVAATTLLVRTLKFFLFTLILRQSLSAKAVEVTQRITAAARILSFSLVSIRLFHPVLSSAIGTATLSLEQKSL
jgi:hypothetical protein